MTAAQRVTVPDRLALARDEYFSQPEGFPYGDFDPDEVILPPDDDFDIPSEDDEAAEESKDDAETGFSTSVGNLPRFLSVLCMNVCLPVLQ